MYCYIDKLGRNSAVGIATRYGLEGSGFKNRWVQDIFSSPHRSRPAPRPTQPPAQWVPGVLPAVITAGGGDDHHPIQRRG